MNTTISKFGYPSSLLHEYRSWVVLLRPSQPTLGSLILACKEDASSLGAVSAVAYAELATATSDLEHVLRTAFDFQKINYLALMMVDPHVHHVGRGAECELIVVGEAALEDRVGAVQRVGDVHRVADAHVVEHHQQGLRAGERALL